MKNIKKQLKEDIKVLAEKQRFLKNQRKTVKLVGERKMNTWEATYTHQENRGKLRLMYAAYGIVLGKKFSQIENKFTEEEHPLNEYKDEIEKIILSYKEKVSNLP